MFVTATERNVVHTQIIKRQGFVERFARHVDLYKVLLSVLQGMWIYTRFCLAFCKTCGFI